MKCSEIQLELPDFLRGKVSDQLRTLIDEHLSTCEECRIEAEQLKNLLAELDSSKTWLPSENYWATLLPRIHNRIEEKSSRTIPEWIPRLAMPLSAAIVVVVVLLAVNPLKLGDQSQDLRAVLQELQPEEMQEIIETQTSSGILDYSSVVEDNGSGFSNGNGLLAELLKDEIQLYSLPELNIESVVGDLDEEEVFQLVSRLEQRNVVN